MGEEKKDASQLRKVHHLLTQGKSDEAQIALMTFTGETLALRAELNYLHTWWATTQENWEDVILHVRDFPVLLDRENREALLTNGSVRRRRPICLLALGEMARSLGYPEEAIEHVQTCLSFLNERRMNIPEVRLMAHVSLGQLSLELHQTSQALSQFELARNLCAEENAQQPLLAMILTGLCETQIQLEDFEQALTTGQQALRLLQSQPGVCQFQLLMKLGRCAFALNDTASALAYAQDAWRMAGQTNDSSHVAQALLLLAEIQCQEEHIREARTSCQQALSLLPVTRHQSLRGKALFLAGQIAEAEWRCKKNQATFAQEALQWYTQARTLFEELHDTLSLARVLQQIARSLEDQGQPEQALTFWKDAYQLSQQHG